MNDYPYFFEWATGQSHPTAHPTPERVIELSDDREEYEFQFAALLALAEEGQPQINGVYEFTNYDGKPAYLKVVNVDNAHVYYKWHGEPAAIHVYPMTLELWNSEEYKLIR